RVLRDDPRCMECYDLLAQIATAREQDSLAATWYRSALQVEPQNAALYQKLGLAEYRAGLLDSAKLDLERSLELDSVNAEGYFALGNVWFALDSMDLAEWSYVQAIAIDSTVATYHFRLGELYYQSGRADTALYEFKAAYRHYPKYTQAYELAATILISADRWEEVVTVLSAGLAAAPETPNTRYWLGGALVEIGDFELAADILGGYVVRNHDHVGARYRYGIALFEIGEYEAAAENLQTVVEMRPDLMKARFYLGRALSFLEQDSLAIAVFDSLLLQAPDHYEAWIERGDINLRRERYADARAQYLQANTIDARRWEAYHRRALALYYQEQYYASELMLFNALNRADSVLLIFKLLGDVAAAAGEDDFAVYYYSRVLLLDSENATVRRKLVAALIRRRLWPNAREELRWFLQKDREDETILYQLGLVAQAEGDSRAATDYFHRFQLSHRPRREKERLELRVTLDSRNPVHYKQLGLLHRNQGNDTRARDYFRKAVSLGDTTLSASDYLVEGEEP
ncbi:MAG: tetratricopeptide repeat protein, partial [Candidatus Neomarinimicrobiota bacterium]